MNAKNYSGVGPSGILREINNEAIIGTPAEQRGVYHQNRETKPPKDEENKKDNPTKNTV